MCKARAFQFHCRKYLVDKLWVQHWVTLQWWFNSLMWLVWRHESIETTNDDLFLAAECTAYIRNSCYFSFLPYIIISHTMKFSLLSVNWVISRPFDTHYDTSVLPVPWPSANFVSTVSLFYAKDTTVNIKRAQSQLWTTPWAASNTVDNNSQLLNPPRQFLSNPDFFFPSFTNHLLSDPILNDFRSIERWDVPLSGRLVYFLDKVTRCVWLIYLW